MQPPYLQVSQIQAIRVFISFNRRLNYVLYAIYGVLRFPTIMQKSHI